MALALHRQGDTGPLYGYGIWKEESTDKPEGMLLYMDNRGMGAGLGKGKRGGGACWVVFAYQDAGTALQKPDTSLRTLTLALMP